MKENYVYGKNMNIGWLDNMVKGRIVFFLQLLLIPRWNKAARSPAECEAYSVFYWSLVWST